MYCITVDSLVSDHPWCTTLGRLREVVVYGKNQDNKSILPRRAPLELNRHECPSRRDVGFTESKSTALKKGRYHAQMSRLPRSLSNRELTVVTL